MDIVEETEVAPETIPTTVFKENLSGLVKASFGLVASFIGSVVLGGTGLGSLCSLAAFASVIYGLTKVPKVLQLMNAEKRLQAFGNGIRKALLVQGLLEGAGSKVEVESNGLEMQSVYMSGGTGRDKALFTQCVNELFGVIDNQRYILVKSGKVRGEDGFYAVPDCFAKRKEDAEKFYEYIGKYDLVYTRNESGRQMLLEGRMKALANKKAKTKSHKKVKNF